jgi:DNA-binding helix-hairpin-helix protein with protein kinase domain
VTPATLLDGSSVHYDPDPIGRGAEKTVYATEDGQSVVALYHDAREATDPERFRRLQSVVGKFNPTSDPDHGPQWRRHFCWPTAVVVKPQLGIIAPRYPGHYYFPEGAGGFAAREKKGKWFSNPRVRRLLPEAERGDLLGFLRVCQQMARAVGRLHNAGLAHSDLSANNVLVDPVRGTSIVIDIDALVVPGIHPPKVLGTPGYMAPEVIANGGAVVPSISTDKHALAVLIYEYLLRRHPLRGPKTHSASVEEDERLVMGDRALFVEHPTDASNRPVDLRVPHAVLGRDLADLFERAFVQALHDPEQRPSASEWERALSRAADRLLPCGNDACDEKWFVWTGDAAVRCPFCGAAYPRTVPVAQLYSQKRAGQFTPDGHEIALWDGWRLQPWHALSNAAATQETDTAPHGRVAFHRGRWLLFNEGRDAWRDIGAGRTIAAGGAIELLDQLRLRLASGSPHGRLLVVRLP